MPAARREAGEDRATRGLVVEVEGLRVELGGEGGDRGGIDAQRGRGKFLPDNEVLEYLDRVGLTRRVGDSRIVVRRANELFG